MKRILLCRSDAIGDLILTLPVARSIKTAHPDLHLSMLIGEYTKPLVSAESYVDDFITVKGRSLDRLSQIRELASRLRKSRIDAAILFYPRLSLATSIYLAGIPIRVGTSYRGYSILFNRRVKLHRRDSGKHELDLNYDLAESIFAKLPRFEPQLSVSPAEIESANALLSQQGIGSDEKFVVIHPLSHGSAPNWRPDNYLRLAKKLSERQIRVIITGSQSEKITIDSASSAIDSNVVNLAGKTDLPQLKAILSRAAIVITGSTGPIHIAAAVGTDVVGIYPPITALSSVRWGPRGSSNRLFVPEVTQAETGDADSMNSISVAEVLEYLLSHLKSDTKLL